MHRMIILASHWPSQSASNMHFIIKSSCCSSAAAPDRRQWSAKQASNHAPILLPEVLLPRNPVSPGPAIRPYIGWHALHVPTLGSRPSAHDTEPHLPCIHRLMAPAAHHHLPSRAVPDVADMSLPLDIMPRPSLAHWPGRSREGGRAQRITSRGHCPGRSKGTREHTTHG